MKYFVQNIDYDGKKIARNYLHHNFIITGVNLTERFSMDQQSSSLAYDCFLLIWK